MSQPRGWHLVFVAALAVAAVGLVAGVERGGRGVVVDRRAPTPEVAPIEARSYRDLRERAYGPNAALAPTWWATLRSAAVLGPAREATPEERAARRAYAGAPPRIPHAIDQLAVPACLSCHRDGAAIAGRRAPVMKHEPRASCVQCHVVERDPRGVMLGGAP